MRWNQTGSKHVSLSQSDSYCQPRLPNLEVKRTLKESLTLFARDFSSQASIFEKTAASNSILTPISAISNQTSFRSLVSWKYSGDTAVLRRAEQGYFLVVLRKPCYSKQKSKTPLILLIATLAAILADGFIRVYTYSDPLTPHLSTSEGIAVASLYAISLFGIIAIHEMGHKVATWYHKMDSTWPYFIPESPESGRRWARS